MAFIDNQEEDLQNQQGGQNPVVGQGSSIVGSGGGSGSGQGTGGSNGWTNIQAYLNANQGTSGSGQALTSSVNDQFNKERENLSNESSKFVNDASEKVKKDSISNDQANDLISKAQSSYNWGPTQATDYQDTVGKVQNALTGQYSGPREYNYGFTAKTQDYGNALNDNASFDTLMNDVYSKAAKNPLTSGQFQLQKQLDVNNQGLADARSNLSNLYGQLTSDRDKTVSDTTNALGGLEQTYRENQNKLKDYLYGQKNSYDTAIAKAEADARSAYQNTYKTGQSGLAGLGTLGNAGMNPGYDNNGIRSGNMTWEQLQKEHNVVVPKYQGENYYSNVGPGQFRQYEYQNSDPIFHNAFNSNNQALQNFYGQQDALYGNTADPEERAYNSILDFLNVQDPRKVQGFKVRG